jgi:short-subunit dehydrogenase
MKQIDEHVCDGRGLPYTANDSVTKAYVLNLGEALHVELRQAGVNMTVLVPVLVSTPPLPSQDKSG